jgi:hypothetical protein
MPQLGDPGGCWPRSAHNVWHTMCSQPNLQEKDDRQFGGLRDCVALQGGRLTVSSKHSSLQARTSSCGRTQGKQFHGTALALVWDKVLWCSSPVCFIANVLTAQCEAGGCLIPLKRSTGPCVPALQHACIQVVMHPYPLQPPLLS